ncbi:hypothetical protein R5W24_000518 [Gemmata sp. JC717]|nr:hypothetical protein [Gemmata algarum]MDY3551442.1 hypothetical protein [Gemmata algarum]
MTVRHVIIGVGVLLVAGLILSFRPSFPGLFPAGSVPVREGELWELNAN